jgi:dTDP-D-glucose 4,6-dehydratase
VRRFIYVSTDEVYGDAMDEFVDEAKQLMPTNPYSASKAAAEMYVWAYAKFFDIPALVVRSNNVYGPCQYPKSKQLALS